MCHHAFYFKLYICMFESVHISFQPIGIEPPRGKITGKAHLTSVLGTILEFVCLLCECWCLTVCGGQKTHAGLSYHVGPEDQKQVASLKLEPSCSRNQRSFLQSRCKAANSSGPWVRVNLRDKYVAPSSQLKHALERGDISRSTQGQH